MGALSGFVGGLVRQVQVEVDRGERLGSRATVGAFTAVTVGGRGCIGLTPLYESGSAFGTAIEIHM